MKVNTKVKVPKSQFVKEIKDYNGTPYWSFFHNVQKKNKETDKYEIVERYVINVLNINIIPESDIRIIEILDAKPNTMKSKDGREFLNCVLYVNAENVIENTNENQQQQYYSNQQVKVEDDDLPF